MQSQAPKMEKTSSLDLPEATATSTPHHQFLPVGCREEFRWEVLRQVGLGCSELAMGQGQWIFCPAGGRPFGKGCLVG